MITRVLWLADEFLQNWSGFHPLRLTKQSNKSATNRYIELSLKEGHVLGEIQLILAAVSQQVRSQHLVDGATDLADVMIIDLFLVSVHNKLDQQVQDPQVAQQLLPVFAGLAVDDLELSQLLESLCVGKEIGPAIDYWLGCSFRFVYFLVLQ